MADLSDIQSALNVKVTGANPSTGIESNFMNVDSNGVLFTGIYNSSGTFADFNYGTIGAASIRVAAQIGNSTGAAAFGAGTTSAQVLRVVLPTDQTAIPVTQSGSWTVAATQSGTWTTGRTWTLGSGTDSVTAVQGTSPWVSNISQFGGSNVVTGTGASGAGIPRVTVSNDSNILATQSGTWTVQPGNTQNTTAWLVQDGADGPVTPGTAAAKSMLFGGQYNSSLPTLTTGQQSAIQTDSNGRLLVNIASSGVSDKSTFTYGTTTEQVIGGVFQDTSPTLTAGQQGAVRLNVNRAVHTTLRDPTTDVGITSDNPGIANNQRLHIAVPDTTISSVTLNAANVTATITMAGLPSVGFQINAGTLVGTITPYVSMDGGATYQATTFYDPGAGAIVPTITTTNPNSFKIYTVITLGGTSHVQIKVTSFTSGSATALLRASHGATINITPAGAGGSAAAFGTVSNTSPSIPGNTATLILTANSARKYLMISNPSGSLAYIAFGNTTGLTTSQGIPIAAKSFYELKGDNLFTGAIYAISASAITFYLSEGTP